MNLTRCLSRALLLGAWLVPAAVAQEGTSQEPPKKPQIELPDLGGIQEAQEEMVKLFHEVERTLGAIDIELADAGAGRIPVPEGKDSGIERLLRSHGEKSDQAVAGIERILELAEELGKQCNSSCMKGSMNAP